MREKREENRATASEPKCDSGCQQSVHIKARKKKNPSQHLMHGSGLYREVAKSNPLGLCDVHTTGTDLKTVLKSYLRDI